MDSSPASTVQKPILAERFKTKPCRNYLTTGECPYQHRCMFAHGDVETRSKEQNLRDGLTSESAIKEFQRRYYAMHPTPAQQQQQDGVTSPQGRQTSAAAPAHDPYASSVMYHDEQHYYRNQHHGHSHYAHHAPHHHAYPASGFGVAPYWPQQGAQYPFASDPAAAMCTCHNCQPHLYYASPPQFHHCQCGECTGYATSTHSSAPYASAPPAVEPAPKFEEVTKPGKESVLIAAFSAVESP